jgi:hypothetical protein
MPIYPIEPFKPTPLPSRLLVADELRLKSLAAGFSFAWPVFQRYEIENRILKERGEVVRFIAPIAEPQLITTLVKVPEGKVKPEDFASEFGLLGHSHVCKPENRHGGDPVTWFRAQATNALTVLNLVSAIQGSDVATIRDWTKTWRGQYSTTSWPSDPIRTAREIITVIINPHLEGIHRALRVGADGIRSVFQPRALVDVVYWQLAGLAEGGAAVHQCRGCRSLFIDDDPRRKYCPGKTCAVSRRVRLFRERQKKGRRRR